MIVRVCRRVSRVSRVSLLPENDISEDSILRFFIMLFKTIQALYVTNITTTLQWH